MSAIYHRLLESNEVLAVVVTAILSVIGGIVVRALTPRGKVAWAVSHQHAFLIKNTDPQAQPPQFLVNTKEIWVQNIGRATVQNIEIIFAFAPNNFDLWPQRHYTNVLNPNGNFVLEIDDLNPREYFTISMLQASGQTPMVTNVRWNGGVGSERPMAPQQVFSKPVRLTLQALLAFGAFSLLYFLVRAVSAVFF